MLNKVGKCISPLLQETTHWTACDQFGKMQVRESSVLDSYHRKRAASSLVADCTNPQRPTASFLTRAVLVLVWFLVARPEAASSIQPSSGIYGRLTRHKPWKQVLTHTHTVPQSALCTPCVKRFFVQQLCTHSADIGAPEDYYSHLKSLRKTNKENKTKAHEEGKKER